MALDPNISLGVRQIEMPNQLAQYAQLSQIQSAQQANQLNQMQMAEYDRARREEEGTRNFLANADLSDPTVRSQLMTKYGKAGREIATNLTAVDKARSEDLARQAKLAQDTQVMYQNISGMISNKADAIGFLQRMINDPAMKDSPITKIPLMTQVSKIPEDPAGLDDWKKQFALGATKYITENKPVTFAQDTGAGGRVMTRAGLGGPATLVPGSDYTKTQTFADINAAATLKFNKDKFEFEKANPTMSIQEDPSGLLAINTRNGVATPVVYGPTGFQAAPAAAPGASMMRQQPAALPGQRMPAIPGMASVLDQTAAPLVAQGGERMPGMPVAGKEKALTETQSNATAFGMRMKEANSILTSLEKAGVKNTGLISGVAGSIVGVVPLIGDKLEGMTGSVFNLLPQIMGGLSPEQQQTAQARLNFITANLRKESGATLLPSEFITEERKYFPKPGDDATVIAQKQKARNLALQAMEIQAGPGAKNIQQYQTGVAGGGGIPNATPTNPLGLAIPGVR